MENLSDSLSSFRQSLKELNREYRKNAFGILGLFFVLLFFMIAIFSPYLILHEPHIQNRLYLSLPPVWMEGGIFLHPLGTDELGRDLYSRIIAGARVSLFFGIAVVFSATLIGTFIGLISSYFGQGFRSLIQTIMETLLTFPYLVFAIGLMAILGGSIQNLFLVLFLQEWIPSCQLAQRHVLLAKKKEYLEAAQFIGVGDLHLLVNEILPNILPVILVRALFQLAWVILMEASLSFLGVGLPSNLPSWGNTMRLSLTENWWVYMFPGLALLVTAFGLHLVGKALFGLLQNSPKGGIPWMSC